MGWIWKESWPESPAGPPPGSTTRPIPGIVPQPGQLLKEPSGPGGCCCCPKPMVTLPPWSSECPLPLGCGLPPHTPSVLVRHYLFSNVISLGGLHTESRIICKVWMGRSKRQLFSRSQGHESQTPYPHRGSSSTANLGGLDVILLEVYFL